MTATADPRDLVLERIIDAPPARVFEAFTKPELMQQWFAPKPWLITDAKLDVRPGGEMSFTMKGPDGEVFPNSGIYLDVVPNKRLVTTDAISAGWTPSAGKPFMIAVLTFEEVDGGKTKYTARARHWTDEDRETHVKMGFHEGWGQCAEQLNALLAR